MDKALELLTAAAEKVGVEAARVWPEMVRLHWAIAIAQTVLFSLMLLVVGWAFGYSIRRFHREAEDGWAVAFVCCAAALLVMLIISAVEGPSVIAALFAPEASLIRSMVGK
ncbi:MAG TPA: hypothetical protein DCQ64_01525 [Candidatus Rokubacteria bacterium]|nr:hypothetical protein [Candidatus Rokubacteria bacterium]